MTHDQIIKVLQSKIPFDDSAKTIDLKKSHGSFLVDANGNEYLDFAGSYGSMSLGYNHPELFSRMMEYPEVITNKIANPDLYSEIYANFVSKIFTTLPDTYKHIFTIEGGGAAVDNAVKIAMDFKAQKLNMHEDETTNLNIVHLKQAFHGRLGYSISLTNTSPEKTKLFSKFHKWSRVSNPKYLGEMTLNEIEIAEAESLKEIRTACKKKNVAAIITELVQSEGGHHHLRKEYLIELQKMADHYNCLLIVDEVQTGVASSGTFWASEQFIMPDVIVFGKRLQCCGVIVNDKIDAIPNNAFIAKSRISSTWGGNLIDMLRGSIIIDIIKEQNLIDNVKSQSDYLMTNLRELARRYPVIKNLRNLGLLIAWDLPDTNTRNQLLSDLNKRMEILACGETAIRLRPFLNITQRECDIFLNILSDSLSRRWR